jgi:acetoacetyl-CoA synthetase
MPSQSYRNKTYGCLITWQNAEEMSWRRRSSSLAVVRVDDRNAVLWQPDLASQSATRLADFAAFARDRCGAPIDGLDYGALHRWSVSDRGGFWLALARYFDVDLGVGAESPVPTAMPGARWFPGASVSYVEQVFRDRPDDSVAVIGSTESGDTRALTWGELRRDTAALAAGLEKAGIGRGDRVVGFLPNVPEAVVAFLATAALGAVWSCCSPDFGDQAVVDRFGQIEPKALIAVESYFYGGREFDRSAALAALRAALPSVELTVTLGPPPAGARHWEELLASGGGAPLEPVAVPFDDPLWILYSSGTTGLPKAIVQSQGGILLEHLKWLGLQADVRPGERLLWLTTTGWTMWNFLVGALLVGATPVLYDGSPGHPDLGILWDLADEHEVTCFGAGASYHVACMKAGLRLRAGRRLEALRSVGSTGSPLSPEAFDWFYAELGPELWLFSTSGGTDVCTAFVGGSPLSPVRRGELQAPALAVDVQAWDEEGNQVAAGVVGELVVTQPMPSMPVFLWSDEDGERLRDSYFSTYPGIWRHGDWIEFTPSGGAVIHGRSDATINRGGVRIGTAEIYRAVLAVDEVEDALVVDIPTPDDESWVPLFVRLREGAELDEHLSASIRTSIRETCSPRHLPSEIVQAPRIPRTLTGKVLEVPVKRLLMGSAASEVASAGALEDPSALEWFAEFARRRGRTLD